MRMSNDDWDEFEHAMEVEDAALPWIEWCRKLRVEYYRLKNQTQPITDDSELQGEIDLLRDELAAAKRKQQQDAAMIQGQSLTIQRLTEENERLVAAANHRAIEGEVAP